MRNKRGQSILEYVIVLVAIVAAVIIGARTIGTNVQTSMGNAASSISDAGSRLPGN